MPGLKFSSILSSLLLVGCSSLVYNPDRSIELHYRDYGISAPSSPARFSTCIHYGCDGQAEVGLSTAEWQSITEIFTQPAADAATEREQIAIAIGRMEQLIGRKNNTFADQACNNFKEPIESFQHDCVAEATNSTVYLQLFAQTGLLRWHRVGYPAQRERLGIFEAHLSAVIRQHDNDELYAVDSWFYANGEQATVVPLDLWRQNYYPAPCR